MGEMTVNTCTCTCSRNTISAVYISGRVMRESVSCVQYVESYDKVLTLGAGR